MTSANTNIPTPGSRSSHTRWTLLLSGTVLLAVVLIWLIRVRTVDPRILKHAGNEITGVVPVQVVRDGSGAPALQFRGQAGGAPVRLQSTGLTTKELDPTAPATQVSPSAFVFRQRAGQIGFAPREEPTREGTLTLRDAALHELTTTSPIEVYTLASHTLLIVESHPITEQPPKPTKRVWTVETAQLHKLLP
ncbi:MAG: hypothetical protein K8J09_23355 [Planctomycetes bacterium]|nr:hypothetical protein [Planctomycetota bacterium]MCC7398240.1 hypothetical protein [Planctomycetota bacterium]